MRLFVVRHGATSNNFEARYTGQLDSPLSALGEKQAVAVAERLRAIHFSVIVSSDLTRAATTADRIAEHQHSPAPRPVRRDAQLRELAMGAWEGRTYADIVEAEPDVMRMWQDDPVTRAPPGGETMRQLSDRVKLALARWREEHPEGTVLWVTHGGVITALLCHLLGIGLERRWLFRRDNASITEFDLGKEYAMLMRMNDTAHLEPLSQAIPAEQAQVL